MGGGCAAGAVGQSDFLYVTLAPHDLVRHRVAHRAQCPGRTERREAHRRGARATLKSVFCVPVRRRGACRRRVSGEGGNERYAHQRQGQETQGGAKERGRGRRIKRQRDRATEAVVRGADTGCRQLGLDGGQQNRNCTVAPTHNANLQNRAVAERRQAEPTTQHRNEVRLAVRQATIVLLADTCRQ